MRQGVRVIDSDTHVNPSLDVLLRYADTDLRERADDLQPYTRMVKPQPRIAPTWPVSSQALA